jgi:hypothetical protein
VTHDEIESWFTRDTTSADVFICRCNTEGRRKAQEFYAEVKRLIAVDHDIAETPDSLFLTFVVTDLKWNHEAHISVIHNDQWTAVTAETYDDENPYTVFAQCDNVEDGIAAIWWAYTHRTPMPASESADMGVPDNDDGRVLRKRR